jgi:hypothetical protein
MSKLGKRTRYGVEQRERTRLSARSRVFGKSPSQKQAICPVCLDYFKSDAEYREHYKKSHTRVKLEKISWHWQE